VQIRTYRETLDCLGSPFSPATRNNTPTRKEHLHTANTCKHTHTQHTHTHTTHIYTHRRVHQNNENPYSTHLSKVYFKDRTCFQFLIRICSRVEIKKLSCHHCNLECANHLLSLVWGCFAGLHTIALVCGGASHGSL